MTRKVSLNLTTRADKALEEIRESRGFNQTDAITAALVFYAFLMKEVDTGGRVVVARAEGKEVELVFPF